VSARGHQPQICQPQKKQERITILGAVNAHTGDFIAGTVSIGNTKTFFSFLLKCVLAYAGCKVYVVLDNVKFHHAKRLLPILERYKDRIELVFYRRIRPI
jgi:putative transposase